MNKAQLERLTQLARASQGKETKRPLKEMLASERAAAEKYIPRPKPPQTVEQLTEEERGEASL